ncbi:uncharacterized protein EDB93DRAFT_556408 [Suillus bovinus]|uniref:uncharacterized protein n=1 Tax=Suillus bovinus TaxID=48563 RepID=UPI001B87D212|nr:uncharacterized protein EDB93DRAFT_556408 [Suillus bovinus]KAG2158606.1 hypothetical protein EDB93DRAFT_556408 [Suillus bovinus]
MPILFCLNNSISQHTISLSFHHAKAYSYPSSWRRRTSLTHCRSPLRPRSPFATWTCPRISKNLRVRWHAASTQSTFTRFSKSLVSRVSPARSLNRRASLEGFLQEFIQTSHQGFFIALIALEDRCRRMVSQPLQSISILLPGRFLLDKLDRFCNNRGILITFDERRKWLLPYRIFPIGWERIYVEDACTFKVWSPNDHSLLSLTLKLISVKCRSRIRPIIARAGPFRALQNALP